MEKEEPVAALGADTSCEVRCSPPRPAKLCWFPQELSLVPFGANLDQDVSHGLCRSHRRSQHGEPWPAATT